MPQKRAGHEGRCPQCRLNNNLCLCEKLNPFKVKTNVSLIVHVSELKLTSNSAQFVKLMLPEETQIFIRGKMDIPFMAEEVAHRDGLGLFLYPHEDSVELNQEFLAAHPGPYHLVVPDGNWHQARRVRKREEVFQKMKCVRLPFSGKSEYQLRKAHEAHWLSTYEATAKALGVIENDPQVEERLMDFFRLWVKTTMYNRTKKWD